jgi:quercetin 2,3-dioxygenase
MSAGSGIRHAEHNLEQGPTRIFQIWIMPTNRGGSPVWGSQPFPKGNRSGRFVTLASGFNDDTDALPIRADARVLGATCPAGLTLAGTSASAPGSAKQHVCGSLEHFSIRLDVSRVREIR